jgi:hypothetical protein
VELGAFSISLAVKDIEASKRFNSPKRPSRPLPVLFVGGQYRNRSLSEPDAVGL